MRVTEIFKELDEGLHDPHIFKAVFMAGSPGSGKSHIAKRLFGNTGLRRVDVDQFLELMLGINDENRMELDWDDPKTVALADQSHTLKRKRKATFIEGRLGMIIDGTGKQHHIIDRSVTDMKQLGYDVMMVFVNTDLETALARNANRPRRIRPDMLTAMHKKVHDNIGLYQELFGDNFVIIDNSKPGGDAAGAWKRVQRFLNTPPHSPIARKWMQDQARQRDRS